MSSSSLEVLTAFSKLRRKLNLAATSEVKFLNIGIKQAVLIRELSRTGTLSMAELSKATGTDPAATGKALSTLIDRGWVERRDNPKDKRRWDVQLTKAGRKIALEVDELYSKLADLLCSKLTKNEREILQHLLEKASDHMTATSGENNERALTKQ